MGAEPSRLRVCAAAILLNALATRGLAGVTLCEGAIGATFGASPGQQVWLAEAFLVASTCSLPVTPWLLERFGQRRLLVISALGFLLSSLGCALSSSLGELVVCLFVQGLATAPLLPLTQALLAKRLPESRRNLGMAVWNAGNVLGALLGALLAGWALKSGDWHLLFWTGLPLALGGVLLAGGDQDCPGRRVRLDLPGVALLSLATLCSTLGLILAPRLGAGNPLWLLLFLGPACAAGYWRHARSHPRPLLDLEPLRVGSCQAALGFSLAFNVLCAGQLEANYLCSQMHLALGVMTLRTALVSVASLAGVALGGLGIEGIMVCSLVVTVLGKIGFLFYAPEESALGALWPVVVSTLGYWMVVTVLSVLVLQGLKPSQRTAASALFALSSLLGNTLGIALLDGFFDWRSRSLSVPRAFEAVFVIELVGVLVLLRLALWRHQRTHQNRLSPQRSRRA